jgi:deoxyxylulose-5-phosphate synthase
MRLDCACGPQLAKRYDADVQRSVQNTLQRKGNCNVVNVYFVKCLPQIAIISLYRINELVFVMEMECVHCAVTVNLYD